MKCDLHVESIVRDYSKVPIRTCNEVQLHEPIKAYRKVRHNELLRIGRENDVSPSSLLALVEQSISRKNLVEARKVHALHTGIGYEANAHLGSSLIRMFVRCGSLSEANRVFVKIHKPNVYTWTEILLANIKNKQNEWAVQMYYQMSLTSVKPDQCVYVVALKACVGAKVVNDGRQVHDDIIRSGLERDLYLTSGLIDMYAKCKALIDAYAVFVRMPSDDVVVWNVMIAGFSLHGHCSEALQLLQQMQQAGPPPNIRTWTIILAGYSRQGHDKEASQLFQQMSHEGLEPNTVTWNVLISGLVHNGHGHEAWNMYLQMMHKGGQPDEVTYMSILKACANVANLNHGRLIHEQISVEEPNMAVETTLMDMYAKCGCLGDAQNLFERLSNRDVVVYNSLIAGYVLHGFLLDALLLFLRMQKEGVTENTMTFLSIIRLFSLVTAPICGKLIHGIVIEDGADMSEFVSTTLIDMYVECGSFKDACGVFDTTSKIDIATWNALIAGYAVYGDFSSVYKLLEHMRMTGLNPDGVTFTCLLSACSLTGAIEDGSYVFNFMGETYGIFHTFEHYGCMVDLFGGAGCLIEAEDLLHVMSLKPKIIPWTSLLDSCRVHNDVELAEHCFQQIVDMDDCCASAYAIMSEIYTRADMVDKLDKIKTMRQHLNAWKMPGGSYIEIGGVVHGFVVGDDIHPQRDAIYERLTVLATQLKLQGHVTILN
ncbi:hypothetical protein L7F22_036013 [Adiantum nelumboides]|nr:hypothetical protein [Adiantum nelumboides]